MTREVEQISIFDWIAELDAPVVICEPRNTPPDGEWWQWNSNNTLACHVRRKDGFYTTIEAVNPGNALHNMCRNGLRLLSWVDAYDEYRSCEPLDYLDMVTLCVHGRNIGRYIDTQGVKATSFAPNRSREHIINVITAEARREVCKIVFKGVKQAIKSWCSEEYTVETVKRWYGIGGSCGPDSPWIEHDGKGFKLDWSHSENGGIYPIELSWGEVFKIINEVENK